MTKIWEDRPARQALQEVRGELTELQTLVDFLMSSAPLMEPIIHASFYFLDTNILFKPFEERVYVRQLLLDSIKAALAPAFPEEA